LPEQERTDRIIPWSELDVTGDGADTADALRRAIAPDEVLGRKLLCGELSE
jgi:hypothetical protein